MKQTLGKIFTLILFLTMAIFANVEATLSSPAVYKDEVVKLTIKASGEDVKFPQIDSIGNATVVGTSSSSSVSIINGNRSQTIAKIYSFRAISSMNIPSYKVSVDGKIYKTKELQLKVVKPAASKNGEPFVLEISLDKDESYVGEPLNLTLSFKSKLNAHADKIQLGEPKLENFWVKKSDKVNKTSQGDYVVQRLHYKLFPQKAGEYTIPPIEALIGKVQKSRRAGMSSLFDDPFFDSITKQLRWQKIYSNSLKLKVNPLPNGLELYGNYQIDARVDKHKVYANKPVNLNISIKGEGNIDDVIKFDPTIDNVIVYADEPKISSSEVHGIYQGEFTQKVALIADGNFSIPSLSLSYFDKTSKKVKTIKTKPIAIEVVGGENGAVKNASTIELSPSQKAKAPKVISSQKAKVVTKTENAYMKYLFMLAGFILGMAAMFGLGHLKEQRGGKNEPDIVKSIRKAKDDRALFNLLLPYSKNDARISHALDLLEKNLYKDGKHKIDREILMEVFEEEI